MALKLYGIPRSRGIRNIWMAYELGIDFELIEVAPGEGGSRKHLEVTLVEKDGTAWSAALTAPATWSTIRVSLASLHPTRSIHIPSPYPGLWNYWREPAVGRLGAGDHLQVENVERLQLTVTPNTAEHASDDARGVAVESILLTFSGSP